MIDGGAPTKNHRTYCDNTVVQNNTGCRKQSDLSSGSTFRTNSNQQTL
ncbi:MAG: hypothetical protein MJK14_17730 [Rivularia sp. ALOHA_DT_140]|nr:hypothetical protein [Rivularia sp. ALOHA_DT_140]